MRVEELASTHAVSVDTVRYYQKIGVLHSPTRHGRVALYDESHDRRLSEVQRLSQDGFSLAQIQRLGAGADDPLLDALQSSQSAWLSFDELVQRCGLDAGLVRLAVDAGLVRPLGIPHGNASASSSTDGNSDGTADGSANSTANGNNTADSTANRITNSTADGAASNAGDGLERFSESAVGMLRSAAEFLDAGMPLDGLITLALHHAENMESVADDAVDLFAEHLGGRGTTERAELAARLIPLVTDLVAQHFRETLVERATQRVLAV